MHKNFNQTLILPIVFLASAWSRGAFAQSALPVCGEVVISKAYEITNFVPAPGGGTVKEYRIILLIDNKSPTTSWGHLIGLPTLAGEPNITSYQGEPALLTPSQKWGVVIVARASAPYSGIINAEHDNGAIDISATSFAKNLIKFAYCEAISGADILFKPQPGRSYKIQRSPNLANWQNIETIDSTYGDEVWRPRAVMSSTPALDREFYRATIDCVAGGDCQEQVDLYQKSVTELRKKYGN